MKLRIYTKVALVAIASLMMTSCGGGDDPVNEKIELTIQAQAPSEEDVVSDYSDFHVTLSSQRDGKSYTEKMSKDGKAIFTVDKGSYGVEISGLVDNKDYFGTSGIVQFGETKTFALDVKHIVKSYTGKMDGIVFKEIFYNGGTYGGKMMHPDQYLVIANSSDHDICVDGLVIAQSSNMNSLPCNTLTDLLPDFVVASNMYQIPGSGNEHVLKPNEVYVIASSALNHTEYYEKNVEKDTGIPVDLSGADFELADEDARQNGKVTDNPEVPNMIKISNNLPGGVTAWMHPYGIRPMFMFDGSNIDWDSFKAENAVTYKEKTNINSEIKEYQGYKIPTRLIVDGVESTSQTTPYWGNFEKKSLPAEVDKSFVQATIAQESSSFSCHSSVFMFRVQTTAGKLQDTNDSSKDMKIEHRGEFKGYPKGWRNSK